MKTHNPNIRLINKLILNLRPIEVPADLIR
jgi:hypothetical protein